MVKKFGRLYFVAMLAMGLALLGSTQAGASPIAQAGESSASPMHGGCDEEGVGREDECDDVDDAEDCDGPADCVGEDEGGNGRQAPEDPRDPRAPDLRVRLAADLNGRLVRGVRPDGGADWRLRDGVRQLSVDVVNVQLRVGTRLVVHACGVRVGTITLRRLAPTPGVPPVIGGSLERDQRDGEMVPRCQPGDRVTVSTRAGRIILSGFFRTKG